MCRLCDIAQKLLTYACISHYLEYNTSKYSSISMEEWKHDEKFQNCFQKNTSFKY